MSYGQNGQCWSSPNRPTSQAADPYGSDQYSYPPVPPRPPAPFDTQATPGASGISNSAELRHPGWLARSLFWAALIVGALPAMVLAPISFNGGRDTAIFFTFGAIVAGGLRLALGAIAIVLVKNTTWVRRAIRCRNLRARLPHPAAPQPDHVDCGGRERNRVSRFGGARDGHSKCRERTLSVRSLLWVEHRPQPPTVDPRHRRCHRCGAIQRQSDLRPHAGRTIDRGSHGHSNRASSVAGCCLRCSRAVSSARSNARGNGSIAEPAGSNPSPGLRIAVQSANGPLVPVLPKSVASRIRPAVTSTPLASNERHDKPTRLSEEPDAVVHHRR